MSHFQSASLLIGRIANRWVTPKEFCVLILTAFYIPTLRAGKAPETFLIRPLTASWNFWSKTGEVFSFVSFQADPTISVVDGQWKKWLRHHAEAYYATLNLSPTEFSDDKAKTPALSCADDLMRAIRWPLFKPPALVTIDDRAIRFTGKWPSNEELNQKVWYK